MATVFDVLAHLFMQAHERQATLFRWHALLYLSHGHCLAEYDRPLIDSGFEAWLVAPVNKELYDSQIPGGRWKHTAEPGNLDTRQARVLGRVLEHSRGVPDTELRRIVRDPVWANTRDRAGAGPDDACTAHMPDAEIAVFFRSVAGPATFVCRRAPNSATRD